MTRPASADQNSELNRKFLASTMATPLLTPEQEVDLTRRWHDAQDEQALHAIIQAHMRLAVSIARKFRHYGLPFADLVQEGNVGLMQAAARFDPAREVRFATYASWWIKAAMQEYVLRNWSIVRSGTSANQKTLFFNLRWLRARLASSGQDVTPEALEKISVDLGIPLTEVRAMHDRLSARDQSLANPLGEDGEESLETMLVDPGPTPEETTVERREKRAVRAWISEALDSLTQRERTIIAARRLREDERATLEELGVKLGITKERVRQIEAKALDKLKAAILRIPGARAALASDGSIALTSA